MHGERLPYIHRHVVCVCVSEQKGKPSCSTGGGLGDRMAIHSQRHGVCVYGKRENHPVPQGGGGFSFLPGLHAQLENHKTAGGISCSTERGGENTP